MVLKRFYFAFIFLNILTFKVLGQFKSVWTLPQHQFTAQFGVGSMFDVPSHNTDDIGTTVSGLNYTYNFSRRWYTQVSWQNMRGSFDLGETVYNGRSYEFRPLLASKEAPIVVPLVALNENRQTSIADIKSATLVKLTAPIGLYERNQFSINFGYMKVLPRNVLRIGVGIYGQQTRSRSMASYVSNFSTPISHLLVLKWYELGYTGTISYDFFLTQKWSLGLYLGTAITQERVPNCFQSGLTIGYAPFKNYYRKNKSKPEA
jgi:hypothetical protein